MRAFVLGHVISQPAYVGVTGAAKRRKQPHTCNVAAATGAAANVVPRQFAQEHGYDIVLSSGFLAFAAHAGFLQAVEDVGLNVRGVMGTSSGAITGALYAAGYTPMQIARELSRLPPIKRVKLSGHPWRGLLSLEPAMDELKSLLPPTFEGLHRDFAVGVVGLGQSPGEKTEHELIDRGSLAEAVVASAAVPVMFSPVSIPNSRNGQYIDGGVACRIGLGLWRQHRGGILVDESNENNGTEEQEPHPAVVHLIGRSSPFSGNDSLETIGDNVAVVCSPKSGASLWDISGFNEKFEAARQRALPVLRPLAAAQAARKP